MNVFLRDEWVVEGRGAFPIELLQDENCVPATKTDAHLIEHSHHEANTDVCYVIRVARFYVPGDGAMVQAKWRARGWNITEGWEETL